MSLASPRYEPEPRFLVDRMLGTLCRYLRLMGYDTLSANSLAPGNRKEDSDLLQMALTEHRYLLTRDRELAVRGGGLGILVPDEDVMAQVRRLTSLGLVQPDLRLVRCSICNSLVRPARAGEIAGCSYAPEDKRDLVFSWCDHCSRLYWTGSHLRNLAERLKNGDGPEG